MNPRYLGEEPCTSPGQVVRYLCENYLDGNGKPVTESAAKAIVLNACEQVRKGIEIFRSNVYYIGDETIGNAGVNWTEIPGEDEEVNPG